MATTTFYNNDNSTSEQHSINATDLTAAISLPTGQVLELGTLSMVSLSTHRDTFPVTAMGYVNAKGFTRGHRLTAGTLVFSVFDRSAFTKLLNPLEAPKGYTETAARESKTQIKSAFYNMHADELPPFDIHIIYANEDGLLCYEALLGVTIADKGSVRSMDLVQIQESYSYMAVDHVPIQRLERVGTASGVTTPKALSQTGSVVNSVLPKSPDDPNYTPRYQFVNRGTSKTLMGSVDQGNPNATLGAQLNYTAATWQDRWQIYRNGEVFAQGFVGQSDPLGWSLALTTPDDPSLLVSVPDSIIGAPLDDYLARYESSFDPSDPPSTEITVLQFSVTPAGYVTVGGQNT
jgi:hypothetical protein